MDQTPPAEEWPSVELRKRVAESHDGAQLLRNPCDNPVCKLSHNKDIDCIEVVWRKYATSAQLHYVHEVILCMLARDNVSKILGDDSCLPIIHAEDQRWIIEQWLPRAKAAGLAAAASVISTSSFARAAIETVQSVLAREVQVRNFHDVHSARSWLKDLRLSGRSDDNTDSQQGDKRTCQGE